MRNSKFALITEYAMFFLIMFRCIFAAGEQSALTIQNMLIKDGFEESRISKLFADSRFKIFPEIQRNYMKTGKTDYTSKKFGYLSAKNVLRGKLFMAKNLPVLEKANKMFGVQKEYITAVYSLENGFGMFLGNRRVFNSLVTHCLYGSRKEWFYRQLKEYLRLKGSLYKDEFEIKGSYSGAFGLAQSLPELFTEYALDFDGDGKIDPFDVSDAIGFIGNFLAQEGFKTDKRQAIYRYNHFDNYVTAVIMYADKLKKK